MAGKYWFFTDVDRLAMQGQAGAFGPVTGSEATQFRVTDLHAAAGSGNPSRAYAVCDGLLRARLDDEGGLTLILKPAQQPSFDFPPVAFFLYKGVAPASLLKGGPPWSSVEPLRAGASPLVDRIVKDWAANGNNGDPSSNSLGLHLNPATAAAAGLTPADFADGMPLDNLFYAGDGAYPPRIVYAGEEVGLFEAARFGLEVVVGRIGYPPSIALAAKRETIVTAPPLPPGSPADDDAAAFASRDAREAILGFVDPCAFWGSFVLVGLSAKGTTLSGPGVPGASVYAQLLTGPAAQAPLFHNRHKAYVDIRNDHGHSLNYYRETGDEILAEVGPTSALAQTDYYASNGWPSFTVPASWLTAATPAAGDDAAPFRLALPATAGSAPVTYISTGYAAKGSKLAPRVGRGRFSAGAVLGTGFCPAMKLAIPLAQLNSAKQIHASYHKLHQFRRSGVAQGAAPPNSIAPSFQTETDHLFAIPSKAELPRQAATSGIRIHGDLFFVPNDKGGCVARPGIAYDSANAYLFLLPVAVVKGRQKDLVRPAQPAWEETSEPRFRPDEMLESGARLITREIQPGSSTSDVILLREQAPPAGNESLSDNFWMIAMSSAELDAAIQAQATAAPGTATLSLGAATAGTDESEELPATISYLAPPSGGGASVTRFDALAFQQVYRDAPA